MMHTTTQNGVITVAAPHYSLAFAADRPFIRLWDTAEPSPKSTPLAELFALSSVHPLNGRDDTTHITPWQVEAQDDEIILSLTAGSSVWQEKVYRFRCRPHRFTYEIEVVGQGQLAEVHPFGGYYSGHLRWGSGFFLSGQSFQQGFNPEPNTDEINSFGPAEGSVIDIMGVPLPGRANWFFTPPPFCFAFQGPGGWLGLGVEARLGANRFTEYRYMGQRNSFYLMLNFEGHTAVNGRYQLPAISFDFGSDAYEVISLHVSALREAGYVPAASPAPKSAASADSEQAWWWFDPIFCGWGAQCHLASLEKGRPADYARQVLYEEFVAILERNQIEPGIIVLDDKWQATYGGNEVDTTRWPDLPGFVARQHDAGRKVLLWLKAWDPEGIPVEQCITNALGLPIAIDPTNPAFARRLQADVERMLSPDGYNADGFKIDFSARIPSGPAINCYGDLWGLELMRCYLALIYEKAKQVKPDALIMTHTPHPYLADVLDMIRLNDMNVGKDIPQAMQHRARIAAIASPGAIIDTDNWPITDRATWRSYLQLQARLGVPSLYYASHVDATGEPLEAADYQLIRDVWQQYRAQRKDQLKQK